MVLWRLNFTQYLSFQLVYYLAFCSWAALSFSFCQVLNVKTQLIAKPSSGLWRSCCKGRWSEERHPLGYCTPYTTHNSARQLSVPSFPIPHTPQSSRKLGPRWKCWKCVNFSLKGIEKILSKRKRQAQQLISPLIRQDNHQFYKENVLDRERGKAGRVLPTWLLESCTFLLGNLQFRGIASLIDFLYWLYFFPKIWQTEALKILFGDIFLIRLCT